MERVTAEQLRQVATLQGYAWSAEELEEVRAQVEAGVRALEKLAGQVPHDVEPAIQYRMF